MDLRGIPRESIPWYPHIDLDNCIGCQECFDFCGNDVFSWDGGESRPTVVQPFNCVVGCRACANLCEGDAISFPTMEEIRQVIAKIRASQPE